jgi:hypothetical protein
MAKKTSKNRQNLIKVGEKWIKVAMVENCQIWLLIMKNRLKVHNHFQK